jgi:hypothetical protein
VLAVPSGGSDAGRRLGGGVHARPWEEIRIHQPSMESGTATRYRSEEPIRLPSVGQFRRLHSGQPMNPTNAPGKSESLRPLLRKSRSFTQRVFLH